MNQDILSIVAQTYNFLPVGNPQSPDKVLKKHERQVMYFKKVQVPSRV